MPKKDVFFVPNYTFDFDWIDHVLQEHYRTGFPVITNDATLELQLPAIRDYLVVRKPCLLITLNVFLISFTSSIFRMSQTLSCLWKKVELA